MKKLILTAVLGLGALGLLAATPSQAKAFWPNGFANSVRVGNYGYTTVYGSQFYRYNYGRYYGNYMYFTPWSYRSSFTPYSRSQQWASRGTIGWNYNPWFGLSYTVTTPNVVGYSFSSYYGYQPYMIPSQTYSVPAGYVIP